MNRPRFLATAILAVAFANETPAQEVQIPMPPLAPLAGLEWRLPVKFATLDGDRLVVEVPESAYGADAVASAELPTAVFEGASGFTMSVVALGKGIRSPQKSYLGLKFQLRCEDTSTGETGWPNCKGRTGDFGPETIVNEAFCEGMRPDKVTLQLGLQGTSGRVEFDLSTLRFAPTQGLFRRVNQDWVVRYPHHPAAMNRGLGERDAELAASGEPPATMNRGLGERDAELAASGEPPAAMNRGRGERDAELAASGEPKPPFMAAAQRPQPLRGCMLPGRPTTEDDIETLASWGATMARFQITRNWSAVGDNQDLGEYAAWVDSRLDNLEDVLRWAAERGMKICVDLHVTPGGRGSDREHAMFRDERFADAFVETWRRIAARCMALAAVATAPPPSRDDEASSPQPAGHPALYGYDLVNEPVQRGRAPIDYWTLQRRAAEAIREIDPTTPIVVESNDWDSPAAFSYLSPLAMDNVIYQLHCYVPHPFTHQGVAKRPREENGRPIAWPDPAKGWDREFLRRKLAPVVEFQKRHRCRIYVGEFSAAAWAQGADAYLRDCISLFEELGWDWTYHAFRESPVWDVEKVGPCIPEMVPAASDTPRKRALLDGFAGRIE